MNILRTVLSFLPFVLFSLLIPPIGVEGAALAGLVVALVAVVVTAQGGVEFVAVVQAAILLGMTVVAFAGNGHTDDMLGTYGPAIAGLLVGISMIATAPTMPFTAKTARARVPRELWHSKQFLQVNTRISLAWGMAVLVLGLCHLAGALIDPDTTHVLLRLAINWIIPVVAIWQAIAFTKRTTSAAARRIEQRQQPAAS